MTFIVSDRAALQLSDERRQTPNIVTQVTRTDKRCRVMHLSRVGYIGGAEKILLSLASTAVQEGKEVFLVCPPGRLAIEARRKGINVVTLLFSRMRITANPLKYVSYGMRRLAGARQLLEICIQNEIDILHAHHPVTALYCDHAVKRAKARLILHVHEGPPGRLLYFVALRKAAKLASRIICVSNAGIDLLISAGVKLDKAKVIHNGVPRPTSLVDRRLETSKSAGLRIAVIGMVEPRKGQDIFVEAVAMIALGNPTLKCHIIGDVPSDGSDKFRQRLLKRVANLGLQEQIEFLPYIPNMIERMTSYDIIVSSSIGKESLGFVVLEAMTQGLTVVATKVGGIEDVINHGVNGFLAEPGCPHSLRDSINEAALADRQNVGREATAIKDQFSIQAMCAAVSDIYQSLELASGD